MNNYLLKSIKAKFCSIHPVDNFHSDDKIPECLNRPGENIMIISDSPMLPRA